MWYDTTLMIKPHEFLCKKNFLVWYQNSATSCDEEMRNKSKWHSLNVRARIVCPTRAGNNENQLFYVPWWWSLKLKFRLRTTPVEVRASVGSRDYVVSQCLSMYNCTRRRQEEMLQHCKRKDSRALDSSFAFCRRRRSLRMSSCNMKP